MKIIKDNADTMYTYIIDYVVGNTYKTKRVKANSVQEACKKARLNKSIIDINVEEFINKDKYQLRDFQKINNMTVSKGKEQIQKQKYLFNVSLTYLSLCDIIKYTKISTLVVYHCRGGELSANLRLGKVAMIKWIPQQMRMVALSQATYFNSLT